MSQGCSVLVLMVKKLPRRDLQGRTESFPTSRPREGQAPWGGQGKGEGSAAPTLRAIKLPRQAGAIAAASSPRDVHVSGAGLLRAPLIAPCGPA